VNEDDFIAINVADNAPAADDTATDTTTIVNSKRASASGGCSATTF
jgi:hypothetical protein